MNGRNGFKEFLCSSMGRAVMIIALYVIIFGIGTAAISLVETASTTIGIIIMLVFAIFGWKTLNRITPDMFLWMSFTGWIIYFCVKGIISIIIGVFVAPFIIARAIADSVQNSL